MIVPSIDLSEGRAVQLETGERLVIDAGDPRPLATRFGMVGEIAVIDLDAAKGEGSNEEVIRELLGLARCRVGGGIRTAERAIEWLDAGASKVILGTAAEPELLSRLPKDRVMAALDARHDEVVTHGWRTNTGSRIEERVEALSELVSGFLVTFVEREGKMEGTNLHRIRELVERFPGVKFTFAGGITTLEEIREIDRLGADCQVGMALYTGRIGLADAFCAPLNWTSDGMIPTVVCDEAGVALGLHWSNPESLREAIESGTGVYHSRKRGLWRKGETSGDRQELLRVDADCDRDALRFTVRQFGRGNCHVGTRTCWGDDWGLHRLCRRLEALAVDAPPDSYTRRLLADRELLESKLREELGELLAARDAGETAWESADLLYFVLVKCVASGVGLEQVERILDLREKRVTRRPGDAK
ncbi:MAG: Histidine biosynthesis bifunctional protein HisIE [Fimbriimonadales bacterium]|nr:Histidine biosynthesis bifunctional protein HisIE [Fimbriimonadales bacterium]